MIKVFISIILICAILAKDPPVLSGSFQVSFDQTYIVNGTKFMVNGQMFYDADHNRERVDRANGRYNAFCGSVLPNLTTPCNQITANEKRYIIFPARKQCCFCCDGAHGCGILKQDWLKDAQYLGTEKLIDTEYDKWIKKGLTSNWWWATADANQTPRRLQEGADHITDYNVHSFVNKTLDSDLFALPSYCGNTKCPDNSFCGLFREKQILAE